MNVTSLCLNRPVQDQVDIPDDRGRIGLGCGRRGIEFLLLKLYFCDIR